MKPKYNTAKFRSQAVGASLVTAITICFTSSAFAVDNFWVGGTPAFETSWNTATNWSLGRVPINPNGAPTGDTFDDAVVNIPSPVATISVDVPIPRDFRVGQGLTANGRVDHVSGFASTGGGNWAFIGREGGTGVYNLANTAVAGGGLTGFAQGSGSFRCNGSRLYVGGANANGGGNGTFNMNTSGTLTIGNDLTLGAAGGTGLMNVDSGTITTGGWNFFGKDENGTGATGTLKMSGGTLTNTGSRTYIGLGDATGSVEMSGGTYTNTNGDNNTFFAVGVRNLTNPTTPSLIMTGGTLNAARRLSVGGMENNNGNTDANFAAPGKGTMTVNGLTAVVNATGELWVGQGTAGVGTLNIDAGTINSGSWVAVGRQGGDGTVNMTGGTWNKTGGGSAFIFGANSPGRLFQTGGLVNVSGGDTWIGENGPGIFSLSDTGEFRAGFFQLARNTGSTGTVNLNGGTLRVGQIAGGGGVEDLHFNGTQVIATGTQANFVNAIDAGKAFVDGGGMNINTNGFPIGSTHAFVGTGGVTKSGSGTLTLSGASTYSGANTVLAGKLAVTTANTSSGDYTVADGATLGIRQTSNTLSLTVPNATFGSGGASTLDLDLGNLPGNPGVAPLNVTGTLAVNGTLTINIADSLPALGLIPLISYVGPAFLPTQIVIGPLPNGVVAEPVYADGLVSLNVTSASLPVWKGYVNGEWNNTTANWLEQVGNIPNSLYADPAPVLFNDTATGTTLITIVEGGLPETVSPSKVTFNNSSLGYFLTGPGKIAGSGSLLKQGSASLTISAVNEYTGTTTLEGGSTSVSLLANGGSPSSIGMSSASASNLVLSGGTLNYTGATTTIDRGFTINAANSGISTTNSLTISGPAVIPVTSAGSLIKAGGGNLTLSNPGVNTLGSAGQVVRVNGGTLTLEGAGTQTVNILGELWTGTIQDVSADLVLNNTTLNVSSWIAMGRGNGTTGTLTKFIANGSTIQCTNFSSGHDAGIALNDSDQIISLTNTTWTNSGSTTLAENLNATTNMTMVGASTYTTPGITQLAPGPGAVANLTISNNSVFNTNRFTMAHGTGSSSTVIVQDSGSLVKTGGWVSIGNSGNGVGIMTVRNSGTVTADGDFNVADTGTSTGTLNIQNNAIVTSTGNGVFVAKNNGTTGTVNLDGGRLIARGVYGNNSTGVGTFNFDGGVLQAGVGVNAVFMSGIDNVFIEDGGATIDTSNLTVVVEQAIADDLDGLTPIGNLTKDGTGTLLFNSLNFYTGTTFVTNGTLGGVGGTSGPVLVGAAANVNPGVTVGTLLVDSMSFVPGGKLTVDMGDKVAVANNLDITNAQLILNGTPTLPVYIIASYGTLTPAVTPSFAAPLPSLPPGYTIDYNYLGGNQIALVRAQSSYELWISTYFPDVTDPAIVGPKADPDGDGSANVVEFALGGVPNDGSNNPKVYSIIGDSSDGGGLNELLMTVAVRIGTPDFSGPPSPSATFDGITCVAQGSIDLGTFTSPTVVVTPVTTGIPASPPAGYEYRTFSLTASDGVPNKGFLRMQVYTTP
ncbi:MAG: autotransporter-associated beta strand repeat-containing protein [Verrucomicrobiota bacterium]